MCKELQEYTKNVIIQKIYDGFYKYEGVRYDKLSIKHDTDTCIFTFKYINSDTTIVKNYYIDIAKQIGKPPITMTFYELIENQEVMLSLYGLYKKSLNEKDDFKIIYYIYGYTLELKYFAFLNIQGNMDVKKYKLIDYDTLYTKFQTEIQEHLTSEITIEEYEKFTKKLEIHVSQSKLEEITRINKYKFIDHKKSKIAFQNFTSEFDTQYDRLLQAGIYKITKETLDRYLILGNNELKLVSNDELTDFENGKDLLNSQSYVDTFKKILLSNTGMVIGFWGKWGSGKSSVINHLISQYKDDKSIKFVKYDAWKYQNDSFYRTFLLTLNKELGKTGFLKAIFFKKQRQNLEPTNPRLWVFIVITILASLITTLWNCDGNIYKLFSSIWGVDIANICKIASNIFSIKFVSISGFVTFIFMVVNYFSYSRNKESTLMFSEEEFERTFVSIMYKAQQNIFLRNIFVRNIVKIMKKLQRNTYTKIVIIIDNIDRCASNEIYEKLKALKMFLNIKDIKYTNFVVSLDYEQVEKALKEYLTYDHKEIYEFISKTFDTSIDLKPFDEITKLKYIESLDIDLNPTCKNLIGYIANDNPRMTKMLVNKILSEKEWFFVHYNGYLAEISSFGITVITILKILYPNIHHKIINDPVLFSEKDTYQDNQILRDMYTYFLEERTKENSISTLATYAIMVNNDWLTFILLEQKILFQMLGLSQDKQERKTKLESYFIDNEQKNNFILYIIYKLRLINENKLRTQPNSKTYVTNINMEFNAIIDILRILSVIDISQEAFNIFKQFKLNNLIMHTIHDLLKSDSIDYNIPIMYELFLQEIAYNYSIKPRDQHIRSLKEEVQKSFVDKNYQLINIKPLLIFIYSDRNKSKERYYNYYNIKSLFAYYYAIKQDSVLEYDELDNNNITNRDRQELFSTTMILNMFQYSTFDEIKDYVIDDLTYLSKFMDITKVLSKLILLKNTKYFNTTKFFYSIITNYQKKALSKHDIRIIKNLLKLIQFPHDCFDFFKDQLDNNSHNDSLNCKVSKKILNEFIKTIGAWD